MLNVKYPNVTVHLTGTDGNVFALIGAVKSELLRSGVSADEVRNFTNEAMVQCSYDHVIQLIMRTVEVE